MGTPPTPTRILHLEAGTTGWLTWGEYAGEFQVSESLGKNAETATMLAAGSRYPQIDIKSLSGTANLSLGLAEDASNYLGGAVGTKDELNLFSGASAGTAFFTGDAWLTACNITGTIGEHAQQACSFVLDGAPTTG